MTEEEHDTGSLLPKRQVIEQVALGWACIMYAGGNGGTHGCMFGRRMIGCCRV